MEQILQCITRNQLKHIKQQNSLAWYCTNHLIKSLLDMPKRGDVEKLRQQRIKLKEKSVKYLPGNISLQVVGTGALGAPRALYLFTDQTRYLFNCSEGTQRMAHEHKVNLSKLEHIFITQPVWENFGGLPGLSLTIQDVGIPQLSIHGPEGTIDLYEATKRFIVIKDMAVVAAECKPGSNFEDHILTVSYVPIEPEKSTGQNEGEKPAQEPVSLEMDDVDYYGHVKKLKSAPTGFRLVKTRIAPTVMCYVCKLKPRPGSLLLDLCVEKGVPPGPLLGQLKNGQDITLPNGTVVRSQDVTEPDETGPLFIVVDCPSMDYLVPLTSSGEWAKYQIEGSEDLAHTVVHFSPPDVMATPTYQDWIKSFPSNTNHLAINSDNSCTGCLSVHRSQHKLNEVSDSIFPMLQSSVGCEVKGMQCNTLMRVPLRPRANFLDFADVPLVKPEEFLSEPYNTEEFQRGLNEFKHEIEQSAGQKLQKEYPRVVFLGTGSCIPNKTRNVSGILVFTSPSTCVLLDCGEGTFIQICRIYGPNTKDVLSQIKAVYISHLHADHHLGLLGFLKGRRTLLKDEATGPVFLLAPHQIMFWLNFYHVRFEDILGEFTLVPNNTLIGTLNKTRSTRLQVTFDAIGCQDISTTPVHHCPSSFGVSLTTHDGVKLTYSGDTMPCKELVTLGKGSDILIHEATMEDELEDEAKFKMHSTTSQALAIGKAMDARYILLTHFSQRYAKLPLIKGEFQRNVGIAFDNMQVSMNQLWMLPRMYPVLKQLFAEDLDEMEARSQRRRFREELKRKQEQSLSLQRPAKTMVNT